jgi:small subunit ribosomal protein S33
MTFLSQLQNVLPTPARLAALTQLRSQIFGTTYNPTSARTGSKILKQRLRGPTMLRYYGQTLSGFAKLNSQVPNLHLPDLEEKQRYLFLFLFFAAREI